MSGVATPISQAIDILLAAVETEHGNWNMNADSDSDEAPPTWLRDAIELLSEFGLWEQQS